MNNQSLIVALNHSIEFKNPLPLKEIIKHARKKKSKIIINDNDIHIFDKKN